MKALILLKFSNTFKKSVFRVLLEKISMFSYAKQKLLLAKTVVFLNLYAQLLHSFSLLTMRF